MTESNGNESQIAPVYDALREMLRTSPQLEKVRSAISAASQRPPAPLKLPKVVSKPILKTPILRLGSLDLVDVPPFISGTWLTQTGYNTIYTSADQNGTLSIAITAGLGRDPGQEGSGHASCWAGAGQDFWPPSEGLLQFTASPSFSWGASWWSNWWREAAGVLWIGQFISRFDQNGVFVDMPVSTQNTLYSFDDRNFSDSGTQSGSSSGFSVQSQLVVDPNFMYRCFVWIGGSSNADYSNQQSLTEIGINASFSSLTIQVF